MIERVFPEKERGAETEVDCTCPCALVLRRELVTAVIARLVVEAVPTTVSPPLTVEEACETKPPVKVWSALHELAVVVPKAREMLLPAYCTGYEVVKVGARPREEVEVSV